MATSFLGRNTCTIRRCRRHTPVGRGLFDGAVLFFRHCFSVAPPQLVLDSRPIPQRVGPMISIGDIIRAVANPPKPTGLVCPACKDAVAVVELTTKLRIIMTCPACQNRWSTDAPRALKT